jgi:hypothetical protein
MGCRQSAIQDCFQTMARQTDTRQPQLAATSTFGGTSSTTTQAASIRLSDEQHDSSAILQQTPFVGQKR